MSNRKSPKPNKIDLNEIELTDLGMAKAMAGLFGEDLRYCHSLKGWLIWNGQRWEFDNSEQIRVLADRTISRIIERTADIVDTAARGKRMKHLILAQSSPRVTGMLHEARPLLPIDPGALDSDNWLLNCINGTIELRNGTFREHRRMDYLTKVIPVKYDQNAKCPMWLNFSNEIMLGKQDLILYLQKMVGYCLTGDISEQCIFILYGSGDNGKTTFQTTIMKLLGDYAMQTATETLMVKKFDTIPCDLARLRGARMVAAAENDIGKRFSETLIKQITGGDEIIGRPLYKEHIQYRPAYKICLSTNHRPDISDTTHAMWRRMRLIPFDFVVPTSQKDKHLSDKLLKELPGILNWAIEGCLLWEEEGLEPPGEVVEATAAYREDMDVLANFLAQRCIVEAGANVAFSELYKEYVSWCTENGEQPISQRHFGGILTEKRFQKARERSASKRTIYRGIRLAKPPSTGGMNSLGRNGHDRNEI